MRDPLGTIVLGRLIECVVCGAHVDVIEIPEEHIDPDTYECPLHWDPFATPKPQLGVAS